MSDINIESRIAFCLMSFLWLPFFSAKNLSLETETNR